MTDWTGWFEICLESALLALSFAATCEGARRCVALGGSRLRLLLLVAGLVVPAYEGVASLRYAAWVAVQTRIPASRRAQEPPGGWEKAPMTPEERTALSRNAAEINFLLGGQRGEVIAADGSRVPFVPSPQNLQDREGLVREQKGAEDSGAQFQERGVRLLASAVAFLSIGAVVGAFQRRAGRRA